LTVDTSFAASLRIIDFPNASWFAADLFKESFGAAFPEPQPYFGASDDPSVRTWHQYVAFYKWSETHIEPVGFCNWIRYGDVYLEGGMCVRRNFYRRLPKEHWAECKAVGGVAQIVMETAARALTDAEAWFGYCGDKKAFLVDSRVGYMPTRHRFLIVKWLRDLPRYRQEELEDHVAKLGPF
jgi:hypothetical protein